jgi:hypothetical protein
VSAALKLQRIKPTRRKKKFELPLATKHNAKPKTYSSAQEIIMKFKSENRETTMHELSAEELCLISGGTYSYEQCVQKCVQSSPTQTPLTEPVCRIQCSPSP